MSGRILGWMAIAALALPVGCQWSRCKSAQAPATGAPKAIVATPQPTPDPDANQVKLVIANLEVTRACTEGERLSVEFEYATNWMLKNYTIAPPRDEMTWTVTGCQGRYHAEGHEAIQPALGMYLPGMRINGPINQTQCMVLGLNPKPPAGGGVAIRPGAGEYALQVCLAGQTLTQQFRVE